MGTSHAKKLLRAALCLCGLCLARCTGQIGTPGTLDLGDDTPQGWAFDPSNYGKPGALPMPGAPAAPGSAPLPTSPTQPLTCTTKAVGPSPMRRLTHAEYDNAVADLLGIDSNPSADFPPDTLVGLFDNTASAQTVSSLLADQYLDSAVALANNIEDLNGLMKCDPAGSSGANCVKSFVQSFGRRAYRRPLTAAEVSDLVGVFSETTAASDAPTGARFVVASMLASPFFLFRPEFGAGAATLPKAKQAAPFELASRLGSLLWASVPDDALLDAAANGQLATRDQVAAQARRMLEDPKAHDAIQAFYDQWLGLSLLDSATKDAAIYPQFDDALRTSMTEETRRFISYVLWNDDAKLSTLLSANYSFVNQPLAKIYGVRGPTSVDEFQKVQLDPTQRTGILTQASLMSAFASPAGSSPIKRGKLVRVRLLCQDLPDPPANIPQPDPPKQGVSTRERFAMHTNSPACSGCHNLIDGLGFGLEHYDGVGAFRTTDQGVPVDSSGEINTTMDIDGPYDGGPELAKRLASSDQVQDCAPTQWLRYAMARRETVDDTCSLVALRDAFASSGGNLKELMVALTQTDAFLNYRQPE